MPGPGHQRNQQVEGPWRQRNRLAVTRQPALLRVERESSERDRSRHGSLTSCFLAELLHQLLQRIIARAELGVRQVAERPRHGVVLVVHIL